MELNKALSDWLLKTYNNSPKIKTISLDGKALRATSSLPTEQKAFLNVFAHELGIVINHVPTKKGGGEKASARKVIESDDMFKGKVVLADAIHTDKELIKSLKKKTPRMYSLSKAIKNC